MDIYSFGFMLWELWHCQVPFDGNMEMALHYVVEENARPKMIQSTRDMRDDNEEAAFERDGQENADGM